MAKASVGKIFILNNALVLLSMTLILFGFLCSKSIISFGTIIITIDRVVGRAGITADGGTLISWLSA